MKISPGPKRSFRNWVPLWVIPVLLAFTLGTVWLRLWIVDRSYAIHETGLSIRSLKKQKEQQELRLAQMRSPRKLESQAKTQFGLVPTPPEKRIVLRLDP